MGRLSNRWFSIADNSTLVGGSVATYFPGGMGFFTNPGYNEVVLHFHRLSEVGTGTLTITIQEFNPVLNQFHDLYGTAAAAVGPLAWADGETDLPTARGQVFRMGHGILAYQATAGHLAINTEDQWIDYTPPQLWRVKYVEAATSSVLSALCNYVRG